MYLHKLEVLAAVVMRSSFFWEAKRVDAVCRLLLLWFLAWLTLPPWKWRRLVYPKILLIFNGQHGVISKKKNTSVYFRLSPLVHLVLYSCG
jgi:hypothetical protein